VRKEPLWLLQGLDIEDKHRTLNLVASGLMGRLHISTSVDHPEFGLTGATGFMPFADGAVILRRLRNYGGHDTSLPLLIIAAPIKRAYIWDIALSVSAVRYCMRAGLLPRDVTPSPSEYIARRTER